MVSDKLCAILEMAFLLASALRRKLEWMYLIEKDGRKRAQVPVRKYPNGPQDERERLWRMNRKQFIREIIRRDPASSIGGTKKEPR